MPVGVRRRQPIAHFIKQDTRKYTRIRGAELDTTGMCIGREPRPGLRPGIPIDDRGVLAFEALSLVPDLANVDRIRQKFVDFAAGERAAPIGPPGGDRPRFRPPSAAAGQFGLDLGDRTGFAIKGEDFPDDLGLFPVNHQGALVRPFFDAAILSRMRSPVTARVARAEPQFGEGRSFDLGN